ncbi:hypothetical protein V8G54_001221 [Vigna mungo]|uniref:Transmembrane protein n=1 Tax=Vigna mungo TaxID=3915 RepID=A0AAQ3P8C8_VIGMU
MATTPKVLSSFHVQLMTFFISDGESTKKQPPHTIAITIFITNLIVNFLTPSLSTLVDFHFLQQIKQSHRSVITHWKRQLALHPKLFLYSYVFLSFSSLSISSYARHVCFLFMFMFMFIYCTEN